MKNKIIMIVALNTILIAAGPFALFAMDVNLHGFISQGFMKSTENNFLADSKDGSYDFGELGINLTSALTPKLRTSIQLFGRNYGSTDNNEINPDYYFGDYRWKDWLGFRAGKIKCPKGLYNETRDVDMLRTFVLLPQSIYPEVLRQTDLAIQGFGLYGYIDLSVAGGLNYQVLAGNQKIRASENISQAILAVTAAFTPIENDLIDMDGKYVASLVWDTPLTGLRIGTTYDQAEFFMSSHGTADTPVWNEGDTITIDVDKYQNTVFSMEYNYERLLLMAEYIQTKREQQINLTLVPTGVEKLKSDGWYLGASYQLTDWLLLGSYYSEQYRNVDDRDGKELNQPGDDVQHRAYFKDACFTTAFIINEFWSFKLEGHLLKGSNNISPLDQDNFTYDDKDWSLFALKTTYNF